MNRVFAALIFGLLLIAAAPAAADDASSEDADATVGEPAETTELSNDFDAAHRKRIYESSRLDQTRALLYSAALPGLGNFYAEQPALGTVAMMSMVFTTMFLAFGWRNNHPDLVRIGVVTGLATYSGSALSAYLGVRHHNDRLRRSLHIGDNSDSSASQPSAWTIGWQWEF